MNININTFNKWASLDKDKNMERGHRKSVSEMFKILTERYNLNKKFNFLDIGCGNGWVIRKASENKNCEYALGIDGSENMINKAKAFNLGNFRKVEIEKYEFNYQFDIIFSMEVFYYLKNIDTILKQIQKNALKKSGMIIIGIDHYKENKESLTWGEDYNLDLLTLSINEWINLFKKANLKNISYTIFNRHKNWNGTLIISALK